MEAIFDEVGWVDEIIVNERTGYMLNGHMRADIALKRGESTVPVKYVDLSEEDELKVLATFDPIRALAGRDSENIQEIIERISPENRALGAFIKALSPIPDIAQDQQESVTASPAIPHLRSSQQRFGASGHTLLLSFDAETYSELIAILARARRHFSLETNSEVVAALLLKFDMEYENE